jgi:cysteine desulfurase/selenocysteine lyase
MLNRKVTDGLAGLVEIIGPKEAEKRSGIFSFNIPRVDPHEIAMMMDEMENICVRSGAHCVHSWFNRHNLRGSVRASLYLYNTPEECERFIETAGNIIKLNKK